MPLLRLTGRITEIISETEARVLISSYSDQGKLFKQMGFTLENVIIDCSEIQDGLVDTKELCKVGDNIILDCKIDKNFSSGEYEIEVLATTFLNIQEPKIIQGIENQIGFIRYLSTDDGFLTYRNAEYDEECKVYFPFTNVHAPNSDTAVDLKNILTREVNVYFDAVPALPNLNSYKCEYFATAVWVDSKPDYKIPLKDNMSRLEEILHASSNPRSFFLHSYGTILSINNQNSGLVCGQISHNHWITMILINSSASCSNTKCDCDSSVNYKKGDQVELLAVKLWKAVSFKWAAIKICAM